MCANTSFLTHMETLKLACRTREQKNWGGMRLQLRIISAKKGIYSLIYFFLLLRFVCLFASLFETDTIVCAKFNQKMH